MNMSDINKSNNTCAIFDDSKTSYYNVLPIESSRAYPVPPPLSEEEVKFARFDEIIKRYEISGRFASYLRQLDGFKVVIICDDSGSMNTTVTTPELTDHRSLQTRFQELKTTVSTVIEIVSIVCSDGVDVHFLNRPSVLNVANLSSVDSAFENKPSGYTPIYNALKKVIDSNIKLLSEKKLLIVLATDGEPTDEFGHTVGQKDLIYDLLMSRHEKIYVSIFACTDDDYSIGYLNDWDNKIPRLDVVDDFHSEKNKILSVQGPSFSFSRGDYVLKTILGSSVKEIDILDEICVTGYVTPKNSFEKNCCYIS